MPAAALVSCIISASQSARKYISRNDSRPRARNSTIEVRKMLRTWFCRFRALASLTSLDTATGRPAVEMVSSTA